MDYVRPHRKFRTLSLITQYRDFADRYPETEVIGIVTQSVHR